MMSSEKDFYIVGIGASAGGLDALERFFEAAPKDANLAYVVIQHLSPDYKSLMDEILAKRTDMPVRVATDGIKVKPNHVYLIPPKKSITILGRELYLKKREGGSLYLPIDIFFESLAKDAEEKAIGVVLSGTGSDGTRGVRAIKERGGLIIVQDESTAKFDGMPRSAIGTNLVDYILPPEKMVLEILNYIQHPLMFGNESVTEILPTDNDSLNKIFTLLRSVSGVDFTHYKHNTMLRRIERRMGIKRVNKMSDYLYLLHQNPAELNTLYREFLIGVTRFFRDKNSFKLIQNNVIPTLFENKKRGDSLRAWVAGCSTGEEAYSLAILLIDYMDANNHHLDVKVFATDIDRSALDFAGKGTYPESIAADISPEYLKKYFVHKGEYYVVSRRVREMVVFAKQNVIIDPPFSKVDLISCRNVLIYLQPVLQKRVIANFQFALNSGGYLFLGSSETLGEADEYFVSWDMRAKIYEYKGGFRPSLGTNRLMRASLERDANALSPFGNKSDGGRRAEVSLQSAIIETFLPPTVIVDEEMQIVYLAGDGDDYLRVPRGGMFTADILKQAREGLAIPLSTAIHKVFKDGKEVFYSNIYIGKKQDKVVDLRAVAYQEPNSRRSLVMVQFLPGGDKDAKNVPVEQFNISKSAQQRISDLEQELRHTRESLQATVEELETSNEELQATNEELFAANEELQSTNEELQSVNEELITVNTEYHVKIRELTQVNEDINNLLGNTHIATIFLDHKLQVRLFTPSAQQDVRLLDEDVGRPISHVTHTLVGCDLAHESKKVLETLAAFQTEVSNEQGRWYRLKIMPYYTLQRQVGGVVISLVDITTLKQANEDLARLSTAFEQSTQLKLIVNEMGLVEYVNQRVLEATGLDEKDLVGDFWTRIFFIDGEGTVISEIKRALLKHETWNGDIQYLSLTGEYRWATVIVSPVHDKDGGYVAGLIVAQDIHQRKQAELELRKLSGVMLGAQFAVIITNLEGEIEYVNPEFTRITGYDLADVLGENPRLLKSEEPSSIDYKELWEDITSGKLWRGVLHNKKKNGESYWASVIISGIRDEKGKITHFVAVQDDITGQRLLESALSTLLNTLPFGITIADREGKIMEANRTAEKILGISAQEQLRRAIDGVEWKIIRPDKTLMPSSEYPSVRALKENKSVENVEMGIVKGDEEINWIRVTATPFGQGVVVIYSTVES
jgi:two-component system CheB/CheR fusion protein